MPAFEQWQTDGRAVEAKERVFQTMHAQLQEAPPLQEGTSTQRGVHISVQRSGLRWHSVGVLQGLYGRFGKEPAPRSLSQVEALANYGLVGDRHACPHSPRQLLIASDDAYLGFDLPEAALRENIRIDFPTSQLRSGDLLRIGSDVVLWLTFHCEPCGLLERRCPGTIRTIGKQRGMLARVLRGGTIRIEDQISLVRACIPAMSEAWQSRVLRVAQAVPEGHYIAYKQLAEMAGVANAYCRAFPRVLATLPTDVSNRICGGSRSLPGPKWDGAELFDVRNHLARL